MSEVTAPIGPATVTVLGSHWRAGPLWAGFDFTRAEVRSHNLFGVEDYHLGVPWMHPDDIKTYGRDPDMEGIYRLRLKRGWRSFVCIDGQWLVSKAAPQTGRFGTPPWDQCIVVEVKV